MNNARAHDALRVLSEFAAQRNHEMLKYSPNRPEESDDESDADSPIFDSFYNVGGNESILSLTNFTSAEFRKLYSILHDCIIRNWNNGRGKRSKFKPKQVLFMLLVVMKHKSAWDQVGLMFQVKAPTFIRLIHGFMDKIYEFCIDRFVTRYDERFSMNELNERGKLFKSFPFCLEAIDVIFQQANRPSGNMQEGKLYFSGKHKLYGYKAEVAVRPNGLASAFSKHYPGSVSDITIMQERLSEHKLRLEKRKDEPELADDFLMSDKFSNYCGVLMDKGYQGAADILCAVIPKKKPVRGFLSLIDEEFNKKLSSDRILVENFFGRLGKLWAVCSAKYAWSENMYDTFFGLSIAFTNFHITLNNLEDEDRAWYNRYRNKLSNIGEETKRKRAESQAKYQRKRKQRLSIGYRTFYFSDDDNTVEE